MPLRRLHASSRRLLISMIRSLAAFLRSSAVFRLSVSHWATKTAATAITAPPAPPISDDPHASKVPAASIMNCTIWGGGGLVGSLAQQEARPLDELIYLGAHGDVSG